MFIHSLLHQSPPVFTGDRSVADAIAVMHQHHQSVLWVTTPEHRLIGIISERIILAWIVQQANASAIAATTTVAAIMATPPSALHAADASTPAILAHWFSTNDLPSLPIVDREFRLTGIIPQSALLALMQPGLMSNMATTAIPMFLRLEASSQWTKTDLKLYQQVQALELQINYQAQALKQSETTLKALVNGLPDVLIRLNREGEFLDVVSGGHIESIRSLDSVKGRTLHEVLPHHIAEERLFYIRRALETGTMQQYEYRVQIPSGSLKDEEARIVVCGENDVLVMIRDISDRISLQHQLACQQAQTNVMLSAIPDLMIRYDRHGNYLEIINNGAIETPCDLSKAIGKNLNDILPPPLATQRKQYIEQALTTKMLQRYEYEIEVKPGKYRYEEARIVVCGDDEVLAIVRDISERIYAQNTLSQERAFLQSLIDSIPDLIFYKDRESRYLGCNQAFANYINHPQAEIVNCVDRDFFSETTSQLFRQQDQQVLQREKTQHYEESSIHCDGTQLLLDVIKTPFMDSHDNISGLIGICRDITDRKQTEQEILNTIAKEKELLELKSEFITIASHEFRTPLTVIIAAAKLMHQFDHRFNADQRQEQLDRILRNSYRILSLLEDILVLSQAESEALNDVPTRLNVKKLCDEVSQELLSLQIDPPPLTIQFYGLEYAHVDAKLLHYILTNLLSNAIKYSLSKQPIMLTIKNSDHDFQLVVCDQGIGIPSETIPYLFQPFHRAKNVGNVPGTGLGLAIVKRAVDLHGGTIICDSSLNQGTTFTVCLPLITV